MSDWTSEAKEYLDGYLGQVGALARNQGDEADEIVGELRAHVEREAEAAAGNMVTLDVVRKTLASVGTPEQVTGVETPLAPNWREKAPAPPMPPAPISSPQCTARAARGERHRVRSCLFTTLLGLLVFFVSVPLLAVVAAITLPAVARARYHAREGSVETYMRQIGAAETDYQAMGKKDIDGDGKPDFGSLEELIKEGLIENRGKEIPLLGFDMSLTVTPSSQPGGPAYECKAVPNRDAASFFRTLIMDQTGNLRHEKPKPAEKP